MHSRNYMDDGSLNVNYDFFVRAANMSYLVTLIMIDNNTRSSIELICLCRSLSALPT